MARSRRVHKVSLTPEQKRKQRQLRRELRKQSPSLVSTTTSSKTVHQEEQFWMTIKDRMAAMKLLNDHRERPYWLSIPGEVERSPPVASYFPCSMFNRNGRWHVGFLFREHRERQFAKWKHMGALKEFTQ